MLSSKDVSDDSISFISPRYLQEEHFNAENRRTDILPGDVLLTIVGTIGRAAVVLSGLPKFTLQRSVAVIRPNPDKAISRFLMYALHRSNAALNAKARGVAQKGIYLETLREFELSLPSLSEQRRIVAILDEAVAGIATAKANAEKNLLNARELFESDLYAAFAEHYKQRRVVSLSDIATDITDGDHMPPPKANDGVAFITISNVDKQTHCIDFSDTFKVPRTYFDALKPNKRPRRGDVLYTVTGSFGIPVKVSHDTEFCFQRHIGLVRPAPETDSSWLYYLLRSPQVFDQADSAANGAAQRTVSLKALRGLRVPLVPLEEQRIVTKRLDLRIEMVERLKAIYQKKLAALDELKQSLLAKAFAGEL